MTLALVIALTLATMMWAMVLLLALASAITIVGQCNYHRVDHCVDGGLRGTTTS